MSHPQAAYPPAPAPVKPKRKKWPWVLGGLFVLMIVMFSACVAAVDDAVKEQSAPVKVTYEVTGSIKGGKVSISYSTFSNGQMSMSSEDATTLPWKKEFTVEGFVKGGSLTITTPMEGGDVQCKVTVEGQEPRTAKASGEMALASCSGF